MGKEEKELNIDGPKKFPKNPWVHQVLLATTAAMAVALGGGEAKGAEDAKDKRGVERKESRDSKELSIVHNLKMFRFRGALYVVDPQDPEGNRVYRLDQGNSYDAIRGHPWNLDIIFNNSARDGGTATKPYTFAEPFIIGASEESYAGQKENVLHTYVAPQGKQLIEQGKSIGQKDVNPTFTRRWKCAPVTAADLIKADERMGELKEKLQRKEVQLQSWTLIIHSVDKDGQGFTDHKGIQWKLTKGKPGSRVDKKDIGGTYRDAIHNSKKKTLSITDPYGREWTREWESPKKNRK